MKLYLWNFATGHRFSGHKHLSLSERTELESMGSEKRREEFGAGRALLRWTLLRYMDALPDRFPKSSTGKPYLSQGPYFNLSHSDGVVGLALSSKGPLGFDIEVGNSTRAISGLMSKVATTSEISILSLYSAEEQEALSYKLWVLKEAFAKASGQGLAQIKETGFHITASHWKPDQKLNEYKFVFFRYLSHWGACCIKADLFTSPEFFEVKVNEDEFFLSPLSLSHEII